MSLVLYRIGLLVGRHRVAVITAWVLLLLALVGGNRLLGTAFEDDYTIPGTESQQGQQVLEDRFPTASGASGQILFRTDAGESVTDDERAIGAIVDTVASLEGIESVSDPFDADSPMIDDAGDAALASIQFTDSDPSEELVADVLEAAEPSSGSGLTTTVGGSVFDDTVTEGSHSAEIVGIIVALAVLVLTFGSFIAGGMPIVTAIVGIGVTSGAVGIASTFITASQTSLTFATMLGLAVGIDYALFILSRHRSQLADGVEPVESMARALGTAGSAVVFAGATVVVSLCGLAVAGIPFLTVMGVAAASSVAIAVLVALTLLPAIALLFGTRLRPRVRRPRRSRRAASVPVSNDETKAEEQLPAGRRSLPGRWVAGVTRHPIITVVASVLLLGTLSIPAFSITLALPDASMKPVGSAPRESFDAISETFGPGYNAPLFVTASIIASDSPGDTVAHLEEEFLTIPGVTAVTVATPNEQGDTALFRLIPEGGQSDRATVDLVHRLREDAPDIENEYGVSDITVTGTTASNIDVSEKLAGALLPFGLTVVGLSLFLLMIVFRSIAVPIKATIGYVLSVGSSFGAIVAVYQWGWFADPLGVAAVGPIVSFLPILVMGVLFGLAMDYEMFLVSRMREEYAHTGDAKHAVQTGFEHSAPVVAAAAIIMVSVFAAFVPGGSSTIQPMAFGLAVGVFVDAFIVRMTLVPAVLALLGNRAWWFPRWLDRALPVVDIEGDAVHRHVAAAGWTAENGAAAIVATQLVLREGDEPIDLVVREGSVRTIDVADRESAIVLAAAITGHTEPAAGDLVVCGLLLPEQSTGVARVAALLVADARPEGAIVRDYVRVRLAKATWTPRSRRLAEIDVYAILGDRVAPSTSIADLARSVRADIDAAIAIATGARLLVRFAPATSDPTEDTTPLDPLLLAEIDVTLVTVVYPAFVPTPILEEAHR